MTQLLLFDMRRENLQTKSSLSVTRVLGSSVVFLQKKCSAKFLMDSNSSVEIGISWAAIIS